MFIGLNRAAALLAPGQEQKESLQTSKDVHLSNQECSGCYQCVSSDRFKSNQTYEARAVEKVLKLKHVLPGKKCLGI